MQPSIELTPLQKKRIANREWKRKAYSIQPSAEVLNNVTKLKGKSVVNKVTEYGALFNKLNDEHVAKGLPPLKTAMEVLIEAMQSDEIDLKDKAKIAEKLATYESSRAPIISIEHVQSVSRGEEETADDALQDFMNALKKV